MSLLFTYDTGVWLILDSGMLSKLQNCILREPILLWVPMGPNGPHSKLKYLVVIGYEGQNDSRFTIVHKGIFGNYIKLHWSK